MKNKKHKIRAYKYALLILPITLVFLFSTYIMIFAAETVSVQNGGTTLVYLTGEKALAELKENAAKQVTVLNNAGFKAVNNGDGTITLDTTTTGWNTAFSATAYHNSMIEAGILSYIVYDNLVCAGGTTTSTGTNLVACLDFTDYQITTFDSNFLTNLTYAITGWGLLGQSFTETTAKGTVTYIDAALGQPIKNKSITLNLEGNNGIVSKSSITIKDDVTGQSVTEEFSSYSLHIILPKNYLAGEIKTVTFEASSLTAGGAWGLAAAAPSSVGLDMSNLVLSNTVDVLNVDANATGGNTNHFHYIGASTEQVQHAMQHSLDTVLMRTDTTDYVEEIFLKPYSNTNYYRIYSGFGIDNGDLYISVYDQPERTTQVNRSLLLADLAWLRTGYQLPTGVNVDFEKVNYLHYERDENNIMQTTAGEVAWNWSPITQALTIPLTDGSFTTLSGYHAVSCSHDTDAAGNPPVIGYFSADGKTYYVLDDTTQTYLKVQVQ